MKSYYMPGRVYCLQSLLTVIATIHSVTTAAPQLGHKSQLLGLGHFRACQQERETGQGSGGGGVLSLSSLSSHQLNLMRNLALLVLWSHSQGISPRKLLPIIPLYFPLRQHPRPPSSPVLRQRSLKGILHTWTWTWTPCIISSQV